jgi:hypothetical protein
MRTTLIGLLLLAAGTARADMAAPWQKTLPTAAVVHFSSDLGGTQVFVVCGDLVQPLTMLDAGTGKVEPFAGPYRDRPVRLCAVGAVHLPHDPTDLTAGWLATRKDVLWSAELPVRYTQVSVADSRQRVEFHYRAELTPTEMKLELESEHVEKKWSTPLGIIGGCTLSVLAVASLVGWLAVKAFRRKQLTRTVPPPGR